jgi:uncharacterized protein (DUF2336 family)
MSDIQTEIARDMQSPGMISDKPRISADSFRNLAARLKSRPALIPELVPVLAPVAPAVVEVAAAPEPVFVPEPIAAPVVEVQHLSPDFDPPVAVQKLDVPLASPDFDPPVAPAVAYVQDVSPDFDPPIEPQKLRVVLSSPDFDPLDFDPPVPPQAITIQAISDDFDPPVEATPVAIEPLVEIAHVEEPAAEVIEPEVLPELNGGFAENFTYVPEPGEAAAEAAELDPEAAQALADRAIELELENIWRMLLAKPTADDRAQYLREAALVSDEDEELEPVAPELDLSRIEPAALDEETVVASDSLSAAVPDLPAVGSGQDLPELMRSLLDIMAAGNAAGQPQERALAADTLLRLVPKLDLKSLVLLAGRLAMMEQPPHLLVARLIRDPRVEIAGPLLEDCPQLTDKDLESVVQEGEPAKLRMMARRRKLPRTISDLLIKSGDPSVVLTLVRNMEAEISHDGFQSLLLLCENHEELLAPLATRPDFQAPVAFELFWVAPPQLRRFILSRFLTDSEMLTKILKITMATKTDEEGELEPLSQHALIESLERAARGHIEIAAEELSSLMHVSSATMTRILSDVQGEAVVVMLKSAGYPRSAVGGLLRKMQDAELPLVSRERDIDELQAMFDTLSFNKARTLLTYWDWAQSKTGPYAPVH